MLAAKDIYCGQGLIKQKNIEAAEELLRRSAELWLGSSSGVGC